MKAGGNPAPLILPRTEKNGPLLGLKTIKVSVTLPRLEFHQCTEWHSFTNAS